MSTKPILDISHHQSGKFDWVKIKKAVAGLIIRVQYGSSTVDRLYKQHVTSAKANDIPFGHYAYGLFVSVEDARKEARDFLYRADKSAKFLVLDVEKDTLKACGPENLAEASQEFIDVCKAAGYKVGFYVSHEMYKRYGLDKVKADFLWLPRYGDDNGEPGLKPSYKCELWQYSQKCRIDGYNGGLDLNLLNGSKPMEYFFGSPKPPVKKPTTPPAKTTPKDDEYMYVVKSGDTLREIADKYKMSVSELAELNDIDNPSRIYTGQRLKLKGKAKQAPKPAETTAKYYTIKSGDTLGEIADKFNTTVKAIDKLNKGITNVHKIFAGAKIRVK